MTFLNRWKIYRRGRKYVRTPWLAFKAAMADKGFPLSANDKKLTALHNRHQGKRCFILGNGPSLKIEDLDRLKGEITFAANKIFLAFDQTDWRPDYYFVVDRVVAENNRETIQQLPLDKYVTNFLRPLFPGDDFTYFEIRGGCQTDIRRGLDSGATVIAAMIQFAYFMGFREIILIGVDFDFAVQATSTEKTPEGDQILISAGEQNHFHPDYRTEGEKWTYPKLDEQYAYFKRQRDFLFKIEGKNIIFNASHQTKLDVFPLVEFSTLFESIVSNRNSV